MAEIANEGEMARLELHFEHVIVTLLSPLSNLESLERLRSCIRSDTHVYQAKPLQASVQQTLDACFRRTCAIVEAFRVSSACIDGCDSILNRCCV
jgi:hypothetical protein